MKYSKASLLRSTVALAVSAVFAGTATSTAQAGTGLDYVAVGDSYAAGIGAGRYSTGDDQCQRSKFAYPAYWANYNEPTSFNFEACSGATTQDVLGSQLDAIDAGTDLVTITVGGNDVGFSDVLSACVMSDDAACLNRINEAKSGAYNLLSPRLDSLYSAVRAKAPTAHVVVLGYPRFFGTQNGCVFGVTSPEADGFNGGVDTVNSVTRELAQSHGFTFVDVNPFFKGKELCSGSPYLNNINWSSLADSFHPNANGQISGYYASLKTAF